MKKIFNPYKKKIPELNTIRITEEAFNKMNLYARLVSEIIGDDKECVGALLNNKNDNVVRDIYLWKDQKVTSTSGLPGEYVDRDMEAKKRDMKAIGLWHSHGKNPVFHSEDDKSVLEKMYKDIKNKVRTGESKRKIEYIVEDEVTRIFEEGSNKELRVKGKIDNIELVEHEEYYVLNSIVINRESYSKENLNHDAEIWIGRDKKKYQKNKHASIEIIIENNDIELDKERIIKEVGEKVKYNGKYLKELPGYKRLVKKPSKGYHSQIFDYYTAQKACSNRINKEIGIIGEILAGDYYENGKRYWFWKDRIKKSEQMYKKIRKEMSKKSYHNLHELLKIIDSNKYAKKKHGKKIKKMCKKMKMKKTKTRRKKK